MSQYTLNHSTNCFNNTNSNNKVFNYYTVANDRPQLLTWLSPLEPSVRHCDIRERRINDIGEWLTQTEEFKKWHGCGEPGRGHKAVLLCYGGPGVGKTFTSSLVVDRLCHQARGQNTAVSCFYFDFAARKEQSATSMLGSLVKQVVSGMETIPEEIFRTFEEQKKTIGGCRPQLVDLVKMLQAIASERPTFICIDALDECAGVERFRLLDSLKEILEQSPGIRIFVTGRHHIRAEVESRLVGKVVSVSVSSTRGDIRRYLRVRLGHDETPDAMDESLKAEILEKIPENIPEMFLLVSLSIEAILKESTIYRRRERLREVSGGLGLGDAYGATIERIKVQDGDRSRLGIAVLMWISYAERPLQAHELCHALAIELGSTNFNSDNIPSMSTLVSCCQGLITVDKEASTVRLIHFTLQEYLFASDVFNKPHSKITESCLTYLNSEQVKAIPADRFHNFGNTPFLQYCSEYWGVHAKWELTDRARSLALQLLQECDGHISTRLLLQTAGHRAITAVGMHFSFTGLHYASFLGLIEFVTALIDMGCYDLDAGDFWGYTPLAWAAQNGHEEVVKILLDSGRVNPNRQDDFGRTPLASAAREGHEEVVGILLQQEEVSPDMLDDIGQGPLAHAAKHGREGVVKILLGLQEVNPHRPDMTGRTPLALAAQRGHKEVVKILISCEEVDLHKPDTWGTTLLLQAAMSGDAGAAKILLEHKEVNPDKSDDLGRTLLSYAALNGHVGVVKILLGCEKINPNNPDMLGRTPLSYASQYGHEEVVQILLGQEDVNPDNSDNWDQTPLSYAARYGHVEVVQMLSGQENVNPDKPAKWGQTPLSRAAQYGYEIVVKSLLGLEGVAPDKPDNRGQTPLSYAAQYGHEGVAKLLLEREDVTPCKSDNRSQTPLMHAARYGHQRVIELLQPHDEEVTSSGT